MTITTATGTTTTRSPAVRRILLTVLAPLLAFLALLGTATQAHAASHGYAAKVSINSYYGAVSGDATVNGSLTNFQVGAYIKDVRNDGYCSTAQMRAVTPEGATSAWINLGVTCSTTSWTYVSQTRWTNAWTVDDVQVRACQSNRYGTVVATCSAAVNATGWRVVYSS